VAPTLAEQRVALPQAYKVLALLHKAVLSEVQQTVRSLARIYFR